MNSDNNSNTQNSSWEIKKQTIPVIQKHAETKLKIKKLTHINFPVSFLSQDYFNVVDYSRNYIKTASNELDRGNIGNSILYLETIREYLNQIK